MGASIGRFALIVGPGIITASVDNDAGGISTYSIAGARFGYSLLWTLLPITVALVLVQEMVARMGVATGKGLAGLIRESFGVKLTFYFMAVLVAANLGNAIANFAGIAASLEIFGIDRHFTVPFAAALVWALVVKGSYRTVERVFLVASLFYGSYLVSGMLARPDYSLILREAFYPSQGIGAGYLVMLVGLVGTTIAPWMQFYLQSSIVEKGVRPKDYSITRWDVVLGCLVTDIVAFFIMVACAATLYRHGIAVESARDAALALEPLAGPYCSLLFAFGLFNASLFAASILPLSTSYTVCEGMGWEASLDKGFREAPYFYGLYTAIIVCGAAVATIPGLPLMTVMYLSQVANGVLLPFVLVFMLLLVNRKDLMGEWVNGPVTNAIAWTIVVVMSLLSIAMVFTS